MPENDDRGKRTTADFTDESDEERVGGMGTEKNEGNADGLARELECSTRTVHRILQTLSMAGVPWCFDEGKRTCLTVRNLARNDSLLSMALR